MSGLAISASPWWRQSDARRTGQMATRDNGKVGDKLLKEEEKKKRKRKKKECSCHKKCIKYMLAITELLAFPNWLTKLCHDFAVSATYSTIISSENFCCVCLLSHLVRPILSGVRTIMVISLLKNRSRAKLLNKNRHIALYTTHRRQPCSCEGEFSVELIVRLSSVGVRL